MKPRIIAYYLPQFHPIPENDEWWGKGFTEWTNVGKAKPLFRGHEQPKVPADLGYYDLRVPESREDQANLAKESGIEGFCYWHYWFGNGKRLLERPFNEVLASGKPDFPFCLAWANESWKGFYHGLQGRNVLIEQFYPGVKDYIKHFYEVLPALKDKRYIQVDNRPLFVIFRPLVTPQIKVFIDTWRKLAKENGLNGIYFVGHNNESRVSPEKFFAIGVDAVNMVRLGQFVDKRSFFSKKVSQIKKILGMASKVYPYKKAIREFVDSNIDSHEKIYPSIIPNWDHTPRTGKKGLVYANSTPEFFDRHVKNVFDIVKNKKLENQIVFLKSWNEWAEGNYMEPDIKYGRKYIEVLKENIEAYRDK